ncbi:MAG: hypothetical protein H7A31_01315 [Thermotogae bacterium]|nr:hypothetical protein [Thermotogota bacterium]HOO74432.1 hypothetical protein [Tepiditoga sp.]
MSIQRLISVISDKDYAEHLEKIKKQFAKAHRFITNPRKLDERKMFYIYRILGYNTERKIQKKHINDFQFLIIHILEKMSEGRFRDIKKFYNLTDEELSNIKFLINPFLYAPGGYNEKLKKYDVEFYDPKVILKKLKLESYVDLYAIMTFIPLDTDNIFFKNILEEILSIKPLETKKSYLKKVRDIFDSLGNYERELILLQLKNISYYHYKLMTTDRVKGLVVDGNNVVRSTEKATIDNIFEIIDNLYLEDIVFFPLYIIFDNNIEYVVRSQEREILSEFIKSKRIYLNSPADEMIIYLSNKYDLYMVSNDQFKEYKYDKEKLFEIRRFVNEK